MKHSLIFLALAFAFSLQAQEPTKPQPKPIHFDAPSSYGYVNAMPNCSSLTIGMDKPAISIDCHGEIKFGEGVTPTEAAKVFARELKKLMAISDCAAKPEEKK